MSAYFTCMLFKYLTGHWPLTFERLQRVKGIGHI